jgi:hypothetical protein
MFFRHLRYSPEICDNTSTEQVGTICMNQRVVASGDLYRFRKCTRRKGFLVDLVKVILWKQLHKQIHSFYLKACNGRSPIEREWMLNIYFLLHWLKLFNPRAEEFLYESRLMCRIVGLISVENRHTLSARFFAFTICCRCAKWANC